MLLSQSEYAKLRGVSKNAVSKAIKAKRIFLVEGKLDSDLANRDWEANSNHRQQRKPKAPEPIAPAAAPGGPELAGPPELLGPPELDAGTFQEAQRQREWERVRKDRQVRKLRDGQLLERVGDYPGGWRPDRERENELARHWRQAGTRPRCRSSCREMSVDGRRRGRRGTRSNQPMEPAS